MESHTGESKETRANDPSSSSSSSSSLCLSFNGSGTEPLEYLRRAKVIVDRKKQSLEALFSYKIGIVCNTSFAISNILGPQEEIAVGGNPVTYLRVNTSSLPHALTMHMVSYVERADMKISVAKDIIPDPEFLAKCFEEALLDMKEAAHV
ncbi:unnamed protein product [Prunus armeniaca]|uniref:O-acyltransferase WSD1 C-terminal domain-containing protein n=1 Tax=Prunus armeniaca TaxID=36596 RepID=A0A6J5Y3U9_PRUAR|nr:unnamed protein product [Prunus armeniaca]